MPIRVDADGYSVGRRRPKSPAPRKRRRPQVEVEENGEFAYPAVQRPRAYPPRGRGGRGNFFQDRRGMMYEVIHRFEAPKEQTWTENARERQEEVDEREGEELEEGEVLDYESQEFLYADYNPDQIDREF